MMTDDQYCQIWRTAIQSKDVLNVELFDGIQVFHGEQKHVLPASRKARAMFGYLVVTQQSQRRERLCDMFWENPDDPRGSLRSALRQLRHALGDDEHKMLRSDRERVQLVSTDTTVDYLRLVADFSGPGPFNVAAVSSAITLLERKLLVGLDLPEHPPYQAWLDTVRQDFAALRQRLEVYLADASCDDQMAHVTIDTPRQRISYALATDGVCLTYASVGKGSPLVKAANWLNHLELDWHAPIWAPLFQELARDHCFIRYDERSNGLSDCDPADISFEAFVRDLETVADAAGVDRFPLLGRSQGGAVAIEYAARHLDRVSHLILWGGYAAGCRVGADAAVTAEREAIITLVRAGWGRNDAVCRQMFSADFLPGRTPDELEWFNGFRGQTVSAVNAARFLEVFADIDIRHRLTKLSLPTLVMHVRGDRRIPLSIGSEPAAQIRGAEFVNFASDNHLLLGREPCRKCSSRISGSFSPRGNRELADKTPSWKMTGWGVDLPRALTSPAPWLDCPSSRRSLSFYDIAFAAWLEVCRKV